MESIRKMSALFPQNYAMIGLLYLLLLVLLCACRPFQPHAPRAHSQAVPTKMHADRITDSDITIAVLRELKRDETVCAQLVDTRTKRGIVMLTGSVDNLLAKKRATEVAESVKGVRAVINDIDVRPISRPDKDIIEDVKRALLLDPAAEAYEITVGAKEGAVILGGVVDSWQEARLARQIAEGVKGVKHVENGIAVEVEISRPDEEIQEDIEHRLEWDVRVNADKINVGVRNGDVLLTGSVGSAAEKRRAYGLALVAGVTSVDDSRLEVDWMAKNPMQRVLKHTPKPDAHIERAIKEAFFYDPRLSSTNVDVQVKNGIVTLTGVVDNLKAKTVAEQDAKNTVGVWRVKNHLRVQPQSFQSDHEILEKIEDALKRDPALDRQEIDVSSTNHSTVFLEGIVDSFYEKNRAEDVASGVAGVVNVENNLKARRYWVPRDDRKIKQDIIEELRWDPVVDGSDITVNVKDGVATLKGRVDTWKEREAAAENAYEGGAKEVRNHLHFTIAPPEDAS